MSSRIPGFYTLSLEERAKVLHAASGLSEDAATTAALQGGADVELLDQFVENVIGGFSLPLGIAVNFVIDGVDVLIPMAVEESSVVAAASNMARLVRNTGGFVTEVLEDLMIGQVQITDVPDLAQAAAQVAAHKDDIIAKANALDPRLVEAGGGCRDIEIRPFPASVTGSTNNLVVHLLVDTADAMGANAVNTMCEALAPDLASWAGGKPGLRILSNLADRRRYSAQCRVRASDIAVGDLSGDEVVQRIVAAAEFATWDPYRATTHNKGIMNGIDPVVIATGNDWRAVEAGAHSFAAKGGHYGSMSRWWIDDSGDLCGRLELPMQVGILGGVTRLHPVARFSLRLMGIERGGDLARIILSVGLAQNLGALRALATEGIQKGHMRLHRRNSELSTGHGEEDSDSP
jgi:hydroxymethylglutaryl-CoA reductase